jgi:hypothetical protein
MSEPSKMATAKRRGPKRSVLVFLPLAFVITALLLWFARFTFRNNDPLFRGRPESEWIKNLKYRDDQQVEEWRTYGEEGVKVLVRGLEHANRPGERAYRQFYPRMPGFLVRWLPSPRDDATRSTRMCLVSLLANLGNDANSATPIMIRTVNRDEDDSVRQSAINFFTTSEDEKCRLNQLPADQKKQVLPGLVRDLQGSRSWGLRNNAANALKWFPEQRAILAPVLVRTLQDPQAQVRLLAAEALNRVDSDTAKRAGAISVVIAITKNPDDQISHRAVSALRFFKGDAELAVPTLIECLQHTNTLVACEAVWALEWAPREFKKYADIVVPALRNAAERKDHVGKYATVALKRFQFEGDPTQAIK